ncbi:glycine zipper family protein [uncultured Bacteroides sp.]|uniref:glycine zipper family protein n=1 Tax=uncultured Bacteroides sp. TaxID=162156 RepID=UPI002AAACE5F|nr:glycine zipper family protein [uncultured Bacteroides sp.]
MRRKIATSTLFLFLFTACATTQMGNPDATLAGAYIGGSLGNAVGGLIGENSNGWRGGYRGSAIGTIVGTIAGAAIGNALTTPKEEDVYTPNVRRNTYSGSDITKYSGIQYAYNSLKVRNIRFIDDGRNQAIDAGETSKVIFDVMNEGKRPVYNVVPVVEQVSKLKHIGISPSVMIEQILPGEGIRYTATIYAGNSLKESEITLRVAVSDENGVICDSNDFTLPTHRKN